jgi:hypothetical protein
MASSECEDSYCVLRSCIRVVDHRRHLHRLSYVPNFGTENIHLAIEAYFFIIIHNPWLILWIEALIFIDKAPCACHFVCSHLNYHGTTPKISTGHYLHDCKLCSQLIVKIDPSHNHRANRLCLESQFEHMALPIDVAIGVVMLILQLSSIAQSFNRFYLFKINFFEQSIESTDTKRPMVFDQLVTKV